MEKIIRLRMAACEFASRAESIPSVLEIALCGSVAKGDPYPKDIDLAVILSGLDEIPALARAARKISGYFHNWDIFVFDAELSYLGRLCHRKECPTLSVDCRDCGDIPFLQKIEGFSLKPEKFYASLFQILLNRQPTSRFLARREQLGIEENREYQVFADITLACCECGQSFVFTAGEQKYYLQNRLSQPRRCQDCRIKGRII